MKKAIFLQHISCIPQFCALSWKSNGFGLISFWEICPTVELMNNFHKKNLRSEWSWTFALNIYANIFISFFLCFLLNWIHKEVNLSLFRSSNIFLFLLCLEMYISFINLLSIPILSLFLIVIPIISHFFYKTREFFFIIFCDKIEIR